MGIGLLMKKSPQPSCCGNGKNFKHICIIRITSLPSRVRMTSHDVNMSCPFRGCILAFASQ